MELPNRGIEVADCATVLGNRFTLPAEGTSFGWAAADWCTKVLILRIEGDFEQVYHRELYELPNIHTLGWVDPASADFQKIARGCLGMAYASCSEGGGGTVIDCMHHALIPLISYESSVDIEDFGFIFPSCSISDIKQQLQLVATLPISDLEGRARRTWEYARRYHTRSNFVEVYRHTIERILQMHADGTLRQARTCDIQSETQRISGARPRKFEACQNLVGAP
jgi:hypothetical protein